ncbi:MAG: hypothetical protein ACYTGP_06600 [Planctomycetota bacterium]|jgi:hypothetical protein
MKIGMSKFNGVTLAATLLAMPLPAVVAQNVDVGEMNEQLNQLADEVDLRKGPVLQPPEDAPLEMFEENAKDVESATMPAPPPVVAPPEGPAFGGVWSFQGPAPIINGQVTNISPNDEVSGALHTVVAHPTDPEILWIGSVGGGIWRTMDAQSATPTWTPLTDNFPALSIGALEMDPANSNILVAGIGRFSSFGRFGGLLNGLLRTTNGGNTWTQLTDPLLIGENIGGVAINGSTIVAASNGFFGTGRVMRSTNNGASFVTISGTNGLPNGDVLFLEQHPGNPAILYASVEDTGIYRSTDTGLNWTDITTGDPSIGPIITNPGNNNTEMAVAPNGRVYASVLVNGQTRFVGHNPGDGSNAWTVMDIPGVIGTNGGGVDDATNATPIVITTDADHDLNTGDRVTIAGVMGNTAANGIFFITVTGDMTFQLLGSSGNGAYVASGGDSWTEVDGLNPREKPGAQGAIHYSMVVDPSDSNIVYMGGDRQDSPFPNFIGANDFSGNLWRGDATIAANGAIPSPQWDHLTDDTGIGAIPGGGTAGGSAPHADSRHMVFDANGDIIEVDDGGVYRRTSPGDNTGDWFSINGNLGVSEGHDVAFDTVSDISLTGNQDTGTPEQTAPGSLTWDSVSTADGGDVAVDTTSAAPNTIRYSSTQNLGGFRYREFDSTNTQIGGTVFPALTVTGGGADLVPQFVTPVEVNVIDGNRLIIGGSNSTYESLDRGATIAEIGPGIGVNRVAVAYGGAMGGVDNEGILYVGSGAEVFVRLTDAPAAMNPTGYPGGTVRAVVLDPTDWRVAFAASDSSIYATTDAGGTWDNVTGDFPSTTIRALEFRPTGDVVFVAARDGVFAMSAANPGVWLEVGLGLPNSPAHDLDYDATDDLLVASTMGRSAWAIQIVLQLGACCLCDGTCIDDIPEDLCEANPLFESWTDGASCADVDCEPIGACCLCTGVCIDDTTQLECFGLPDAERWEMCTPCDELVPECEPTGACCLCDGTCIDDVTEADCFANPDARAWAACSDCASIVCEPVGACCLCTGECIENQTQQRCLDNEFAVAWFECELCPDLDPPCEPTGACCLCDGTCIDDLTLLECQNADPDYISWAECADCLDVECVPRGACCLCDGTCTDDVTEADCLANPLYFSWSECVDCVDLDPPCEPTGACCLCDTTCIPDLTEAECMANALYSSWTECGKCEEIVCPETGACCVAAGTCLDHLSEVECLDLNGYYQGTCTLCPPPGPNGDVVSASSNKGSLLYFSKVDIRWDAAGFLVQDTYLSISNDWPTDVKVQMYFINGDPPLDAVGGERAHLGWNWFDVTLNLTGDQPTYWSAHSGLPAGVPPFMSLDPGFPPGRPAPDGGRMMRGYIIAWAVNDGNEEISWNHLSGVGTIVEYLHGSAWEYGAEAFPIVNETPLGQQTGTPGVLNLSGLEYARTHDTLVLNFQAAGASAFSGPRQVLSNTSVTLHPLSVDVRQINDGPVTTKADYSVWNQNEVKLSGTHKCVTCWDQTLISDYDPPNNLLLMTLQTDHGKARIRGLEGPIQCDTAELVSRQKALAGLQARHLSFDAGADRATAGERLIGDGFECAQVKYDVLGFPAIGMPSDPEQMLPWLERLFDLEAGTLDP